MAVMHKNSLNCLKLVLLTLLFLGARISLAAEGNAESHQGPTVYQCRSHIEAALKTFITTRHHEEPQSTLQDQPQTESGPPSDQEGTDITEKTKDTATQDDDDDVTAATEATQDDDDEVTMTEDDEIKEGDQDESQTATGEAETADKDATEATEDDDGGTETKDKDDDTQASMEEAGEDEVTETGEDSVKDDDDQTEAAKETTDEVTDKGTEETETGGEAGKEETETGEDEEAATETGDATGETAKGTEKDTDETEEATEAAEGTEETAEGTEVTEAETEGDEATKTGEGDDATETGEGDEATETGEDDKTEADDQSVAETDKTVAEDDAGESDAEGGETATETEQAADETQETEAEPTQTDDESTEAEEQQPSEAEETDKSDDTVAESESEDQAAGEPESEQSEEDDEKTEVDEDDEETEEDVSEYRSREHITQILGLGEEAMTKTIATERSVQNTLKELKKMYENAIKPMENLYKFKDISNRYVGDAELFSKPMILFIGPWSSGKSAMINYFLDTEDTPMALRTGAEPQSNGFTVLMYGDTEQQMDGIEVATDWTFSSLQKFGQSFQDRLQGVKLPNNLLRKVTIVDTPGILENRKQQERTYPFNDACQWFIDRADVIYVVFDPTKLDMGLEMEALFDQLKGREAHVRILLNKADSVKPQELMRVQSTLLWNLSPLLGSAEPPVIFVGTFWAKPYLPDAPETLFEAQEAALLQDLRQTIDGRVENRISFTRRHAVRVRNHAKMVDCYLDTYYNHKTFFSNKKKVAEEITENPQNYHIYEGLSTLTNVSRYDLPDPDIYRDFFKVNPLYEFKLLASTCSYFKGCPLDKLDMAISYDLPELMGKYRKLIGTTTQHGRS